MKLPARWATNLNYATGPDSGTPTKVDPASTPNGFVRGTAASAQAVNFLLDAQGQAARRALSAVALTLRELRSEGLVVLDAASSMAAAAVGEGFPIVLAKTTQALGTNDAGRLDSLGTIINLTSLVANAACNPATKRILISGQAAGTGGFAFSDDSGETWSSGAAGAIVPGSNGLVWNAPKGKFIAADSTTSLSSADGVTAWDVQTISNNSSGGLAVLSSGVTVACGDGAAVAFSLSANGGTTWSDASGTIPNAGGAANAGSLAGNGGATIYHLAQLAATFQASSSLDGSTWTVAKTFAVTGTLARPRIIACQNTGLLVALMPFVPSAGTQVVTAVSFSVDGTEWSDLSYYNNAPIAAFAVAGGRLFLTQGSQFFGSAGVGWR